MEQPVCLLQTMTATEVLCWFSENEWRFDIYWDILKCFAKKQTPKKSLSLYLGVSTAEHAPHVDLAHVVMADVLPASCGIRTQGHLYTPAMLHPWNTRQEAEERFT